MTQIIWKLSSGGIAITQLVDATDAESEAAKLLEAGLVAADWTVDHIRNDENHYIVDDALFFGALTANGGEIVIDMDKAREIWRGAIREARAPKLAALDVAWQRASEDGREDAKAKIVAAKQLLRDLPEDAAIAKAKSIADLRAFWPDVLS
ncbi:hypothetical protein [Novosphingobium sp.]|uniref:hypothetical protein n=1 Tax=Novosphingobium sp. TaxID=1874826 RepID=UPI00261F52C5|nr:hypothetical protein [Novosphingobium sp.]